MMGLRTVGCSKFSEGHAERSLNEIEKNTRMASNASIGMNRELTEGSLRGGIPGREEHS